MNNPAIGNVAFQILRRRMSTKPGTFLHCFLPCCWGLGVTSSCRFYEQVSCVFLVFPSHLLSSVSLLDDSQKNSDLNEPDSPLDKER